MDDWTPMEQVHALAPVILLLLVGILAIALMRSLGLSRSSAILPPA